MKPWRQVMRAGRNKTANIASKNTRFQRLKR